MPVGGRVPDTSWTCRGRVVDVSRTCRARRARRAGGSAPYDGEKPEAYEYGCSHTTAGSAPPPPAPPLRAGQYAVAVT